MRILCPLRTFYVEDGLIWGLRQVGCEVLVLAGRPVQRSQLVAAVEEFRPDLLFSYAWWQERLLPEDLAWLCERYRLFHVYWASDDPTHHLTISLPLARLANLVFTTTEEMVAEYRAMGKKAAYLQHACNPVIHRRVNPDKADRHDIVLVAANYSQDEWVRTTYRNPSTRLMLDPLIQAGLDLKVFGGGWAETARSYHLPARFAGPEVSYQQLASVCSSAKIVLGLQTECHWSTQTSCRLFEVLGCRAFHLAPATRATTNLFVPGRHLVVSHTPAETTALARYYLDHDEERERIAAAGQLEVYRNHTCLHRARELLATVRELF